MCRPEKEIDWELVDRKLIAGCIGTEIAPIFDLTPGRFYERVEEKFNTTFTEYRQQKRSIGDSNIREVQYNKAIEGDNSMLIWLGKNRLNQSDSPQEISVNPQTIAKFNSLMNQLSSIQSSRQISDNTNNTESKS